MAAVAPINDASLQRGAPVTPKAKVSSGPVTWLDRLAVSPVPYYLCFSTPIFQWIGIHWLGTQWGAILLMFGIVPILDAFVPVDIADPSPQNPTWQGPIGQILYKIPLWTWPFITTWELLWACSMIANPDAGLTWMDTLGIWFTCSAYTGGMGFTIAHELLHKPELFEKGLAYWLLSLTSYMHYFDEHQLGHHKWVATPQDPSTAKLGQNIFAYYAQTIPGTWLSAWEINAAEMKLQGKQVWSADNKLIWFFVIPFAIASTLALYFQSFNVIVFFYAQAILSFMLLETINYVEHYGLLRKKLENGRFEPVNPMHSWNSPHRLTNYFLFKLQRHCDHHAHAMRPYELLRNYSDAPQLPAGYPSMILLAIIPSKWFGMFDQAVINYRKDESKGFVFDKNLQNDVNNFLVKVSGAIVVLILLFT